MIYDNKNKFKVIVALVIALVLLFLAGLPASAEQAFWSDMESGTTSDLYGIWGTGEDNVFAAGKSGTVLHYNGSSWSPMASSVTADLYAIWGSDGNNIFAAGKSGAIINYDGSSWAPVVSGTTSDLYAIWGADSTHIFSVGKSGTIIRYDGSSWTPMASGTTVDLYAIWGADSTHIFATGKSGAILRYDGSSWTAMSSGTTSDLYGIWGVDSTLIYAAGQSGTVIRYNGSSWSSLSSGTAVDLYRLWGSDNTHVFMAGGAGVILNYDGLNFNSMSRNTVSDLRSVWGLSSSNIFIAGYSGTILRYCPPVISTILPGEGFQGETLDITINGTNFTGASELWLGTGISVNSFTVTNASQIGANISILSGAATGSRDVSVITPEGSFTLTGGFTVKPALPAITSINPPRGNQGVTLNVTIIGENFTEVSSLQFGSDVTVNSFTVINSGQIVAEISIAADAIIGNRNVSVTTPGGSNTLSNGFAVKQALPVITLIEANQGRQGETLNVTLSGNNFNGASEISLGDGIVVNSFTVVNSGRIDASITISPDAVTGNRDVYVTTPGGVNTLSNGFKVIQALPVITSIEPDQGRQGETLNLTITGSNFSGVSAIQFGAGISVNSFNLLSSGQISVNITIVSDTEAGSRDISVTTPGGSQTLSNGFTVKQAQPLITSVSPDSGNRGAALTVTLNGENLDGATSVGFGAGIEVTGFTGISSMQLLVNLIISSDAATGFKDISVTTPGGSYTLPGSFTIKQELPLITSLSINSGNQGATMNINIGGDNFIGMGGINFGSGILVNSFTVLGSNQLSVNITILSDAAVGTRDVSVTTPGGTYILPGGFTVKQALPSITSVSPDRGNPGSTLVVIVNGSNLSGTTSVSFGNGVEVTGLTNVSPTQLGVYVTVFSDAVIGYRDISIVTPGGSTTFGQGFSIEEKSQNTVALISIWTGIAVVFIILTVILNILRRKRAARL
jgi:hypothetical protein